MPADVRFIFGRSGSGKTHAVMTAIAANEAAGKRSLLIVPDRATFETERMLSAFLGGGMLETSVLSFTRLANRIMNDAGERRSFLSAQGRLMLERRIIDESAGELQVFRRVSRHKGFAAECDAVILNCKRFMIAPEQLTEARGLPEQLSAKLSDFALIYKKLGERMAERYIDGEDLINNMIGLLPGSFVRGTEVFIDAPDMLNVQSIRIIETLFTTANSVTITFRGDPDAFSAVSPDAYIFEPDVDRCRRLRTSAKELGCRFSETVLSGNRRAGGALAALESNLFAFPYEVYGGSARNIELHSSLDRQNEVRDAAEHILSAVRSGMRYRDIAVAVSDLAAYSGMLRRCFGQYGIPLFTDANRPVSAHPVSELMLGALRCVQNDFRSEDFIRVLKTGLTGLSDEECEKLENYIIRFALSGKRLYSSEPSVKVKDRDEDFSELERLRLAAAGPITELKNTLSEGKDRSALAKVRALYAYLERLETGKKLKEESEKLEAEPEMLLYASENRQIYDTVIALLDQIAVIIGDETIGLERFISVLDEGLCAYTVGTIPTTLDQVIAGDISSIHLPEIKYLIVLGANEGLFPKARDDNSIIDDRDLAAMRAAGINAWDSSVSMNRAERLNLYSLLTKPSERLSVFYSKNIDKTPARLSAVAARIGSIFPHSARTIALRSGNTYSPDVPGTEETALSDLARLTRRFIDTGTECSGLEMLYAHFAQSDAYREPLKALDSMYFDDNSPEPLGQPAALRLYGKHITGSPTRLEIFNSCPFRYVMKFGLKLEERALREEKAVDHGKLIHDALDKLFRRLLKDKTDLTTVTRQQLSAILDEFLPELFEGHNYGILLDSAFMRSELEKLREEIEGIAFVVIRQITSGSFRPYASELSFGGEKDSLPALELVSSSGARLRIVGIVDRVDKLSLPDGSEYFRIIDYKTGKVRFDYSELSAGLRLQLPLYAAALRAAFSAAARSDPSGLYYMHVRDANDVSGDDEKDEASLMKSMKLSGPTVSDSAVITASDGTEFQYSMVIEGLKSSSGKYSGSSLISAEEMQRALTFAEEVGKVTLDAIMLGRAEVSPARLGRYSSCTYCPYVSICRFDTIAGSRFRHIRKVKKNDFFERKN